MRRIDVSTRPSEAERSAAIGFVERIAEARGQRPLSDQLWLDLTADSASGQDSLALAVTVLDPSGVLAYAQVSGANEGATLEVVVDESVADAAAIHDDIAETAIDAFRRAVGGHLTWWVDTDDAHIRSVAEAGGLELARALHQMRVALPLDSRSSVPTRAFTRDDAAAWVTVNNRAFASHPEQGGWTVDTLALRYAEPWFDPSGFRLYEADGRLVGFCWTKIHHDVEPPVGEIYVIGVDPEFHGRGLGRELTLAGLDWLADRGLTQAILFVDGGNTPALRLYERLGFEVERTRYAFAGTLTG